MTTSNETATLTTSAVQWLTNLAQEAQRDLGELPESVQPFWFRHNPDALSQAGQ
jgi:hypothetical protein